MNAQMAVSKKIPYRIKRYYVYALITIVALTLPFIKINGNHIFLLSFDKKQFHLMGIVFDMQELYLMPFLLMLLFLGIFAVTTIGGRAWCGWACPQTIFRVIYRDLIESKLLGLRKIRNKQKEPNWGKTENRFKKFIAIIIWCVLSLAIVADFMWFFVPPEDFFIYLQSPFDHLFLIGFVLIVATFLIFDVIWVKENFCIYVCPYSRVQSVLYDNDTYQAIYSNKRGGQIYNENKEKIIFKKKDLQNEADECTVCQSCVTVCPTHIDIRKGLQLECINCLECVDACTQVMGKLGKRSLVQWSSTRHMEKNEETKVIRKSTIMYSISLIIIISFLLVMGGEKEHMLLNVNKTTQLYKIKKGNVVSNNFLFLFQNTDLKSHTYALQIINNNGIKIKRFRPFKLDPKRLAKKIVILYANKILVRDKTKDTPINITIRAYALDEPQRVQVLRKVVFMYPRLDRLTGY